MSKKLGRGEFPVGHGPDDFEAFGPAATKDGEFQGTYLADLGCFMQEEVDSNKYYHGGVYLSKKNGKFYFYVEYGRVGAGNPQIQFTECNTKDEAQAEYIDQLESKNIKRGQWETHKTLGKRLIPKPGKDLYLVRSLATRSTGLPAAKTIKTVEGLKKQPVTESKKTTAAKIVEIQKQTSDLLKALSIATLNYTKGAMADDTLPTQPSIDDARNILQEALKRVAAIGNDVAKQVGDRELKQLTRDMYSRIPKKKERGAAAETWILSQENIGLWNLDLDAFEAALYSQDFEVEESHDPYGGMRLTMKWLDPSSDIGKYLYQWWPKATANRHGHLRDMQIKNLWEVSRLDDVHFRATQERVVKEIGGAKICERPLFQPRERVDLNADDVKLYQNSNTALLFHGTRSVNVSGILRESFRLPRQLVGVQITGAMFGGGIYKADDWKKSAGYTSLTNSIWSNGGGGIHGRGAFMFAADTILGQPHVAPHSHPYTAPPSGTHCVFGMGTVHNSQRNSGVQNNEWIVFNTKQARIRYLAEFVVK